MLGIKSKQNLFLSFFLILFFLIVFYHIDNLLTEQNPKLIEKYSAEPYIFKTKYIHCTNVILIKNCIEGIEKRKSSKKIIIIGNSQLHHINRMKENDILASQILFKNFIEKKVDIVTLSLPNINLQEIDFIYQKYIKEIELDYLVISLVFDDLRETSIRNELKSPIETQKKKNLLFERETNKRDELKSSIETQKKKNLLFEKIKNQILLKKNNFIFHVYNLRNYLFNIDSSSKREIIETYYYKNLKSYKSILNQNDKNNLKFISYFAPMRKKPFEIYDRKEYEKFKKDILDLNSIFGQKIYDLDDIVPSNNFDSLNKKNFDYMHFDYLGHKKLANELENILKTLLNSK